LVLRVKNNMNIKKWFITHGPGSIGDSANTIIKVYKNLKVVYPDLPEKDLYKLVLKTRRDHVKKLHGEFDLYAQDNFINEDVDAYGSDLSTLIIREIKLEYPILEEIEINDSKLYDEAIVIIKEVVEKNL